MLAGHESPDRTGLSNACRVLQSYRQQPPFQDIAKARGTLLQTQLSSPHHTTSRLLDYTKGQLHFAGWILLIFPSISVAV